eukprot:CAMPEP_0179220096 /NCGR_PEP_ID=MMETSP0797-20121207/5415_1 /TAXON_ID=47934 /ORGANISM="Dinophysis acuminata, Strain DAEP01" /LENGTH=183 /DNA_ID=CAMNT_0020926669 /DNA_START=521 /DNA_END=1074 /DNA_ORIENTATION=+
MTDMLTSLMSCSILTHHSSPTHLQPAEGAPAAASASPSSDDLHAEPCQAGGASTSVLEGSVSRLSSAAATIFFDDEMENPALPGCARSSVRAATEAAAACTSSPSAGAPPGRHRTLAPAPAVGLGQHGEQPDGNRALALWADRAGEEAEDFGHVLVEELRFVRLQAISDGLQVLQCQDNAAGS